MICDICGDGISKPTEEKIKNENTFVALCNDCYETLEESEKLFKEEDEFDSKKRLYPEFSF